MTQVFIFTPPVTVARVAGEWRTVGDLLDSGLKHSEIYDAADTLPPGDKSGHRWHRVVDQTKREIFKALFLFGYEHQVTEEIARSLRGTPYAGHVRHHELPDDGPTKRTFATVPTLTTALTEIAELRARVEALEAPKRRLKEVA